MARIAAAMVTVAALAAAAVAERAAVAASFAVLGHLSWPWIPAAVLLESASMAAFAVMLRRLLAAGGASVGVRPMLATAYAANAVSVSVPLAGPALATAFTFRRFTRQGADAPLAEQVQHDPLGIALLTRTARRQLARLAGGRIAKHGGLGNRSTGGSRGAIWLAVVVPEPFIDDLPVRSGPPPHHPSALQLAADLVDALPRRDARSVRKLVVVERTRIDTHRLNDAVAMAARLHDRQYAPRTWSRLCSTSSSPGSRSGLHPASKGAHNT